MVRTVTGNGPGQNVAKENPCACDEAIVTGQALRIDTGETLFRLFDERR